MAAPGIAVPGTVIPSGVLVTPGGPQGIGGIQGPSGPNAVSAQAGNQAVLGTDNLIYVPDPTPVITSVRLRSFNAIGNPNSEVDQVLAGSAANITGSVRLCDRWWASKTGTMTATASASANNTFVPGTNYLVSSKVLALTLTGQEATLAAGDNLIIYQQIEGSVFRELSKDVHSLSILAYCTQALTFSLSIQDNNQTHSLVNLCTIPANAMTLVKLPNLALWPGAGSFSVLPGNLGYFLVIGLACGSSSIAPATATWQAGNFYGGSGMTNFASLPVNTQFWMGFIQHEPGPNCTQLIDLDFATNLDRCQRYYDKSAAYSSVPNVTNAVGSVGNIWAQANNHPYVPIFFKRRMAKVPTVTAYSVSTGAVNTVRDTSANVDRAVSGNQSLGESGYGGHQISTLNAAMAFYMWHYSADTGW